MCFILNLLQSSPVCRVVFHMVLPALIRDLAMFFQGSCTAALTYVKLTDNDISHMDDAQFTGMERINLGVWSQSKSTLSQFSFIQLKGAF